MDASAQTSYTFGSLTSDTYSIIFVDDLSALWSSFSIGDYLGAYGWTGTASVEQSQAGASLLNHQPITLEASAITNADISSHLVVSPQPGSTYTVTGAILHVDAGNDVTIYAFDWDTYSFTGGTLLATINSIMQNSVCGTVEFNPGNTYEVTNVPAGTYGFFAVDRTGTDPSTLEVGEYIGFYPDTGENALEVFTSPGAAAAYINSYITSEVINANTHLDGFKVWHQTE